MEYFQANHPEILNEIAKGERTFFRTIGDSIVLGRKTDDLLWILEGKYNQGRSIYKNTYATDIRMKFTELLIHRIVASYGNIFFNAMPLAVDGYDTWYLIAIILPMIDTKSIQQHFTQDIRKVYISQIIDHEISHILVEDFLDESGDIRHFKAELLADTFLIHDILERPDYELLLKVKHYDVKSIMVDRDWSSSTEYYKIYLNVMDEILSIQDSEDLRNRIEKLQEVLTQPCSGNLNDIYDDLVARLRLGKR